MRKHGVISMDCADFFKNVCSIVYMCNLHKFGSDLGI